MKTDRCALMAVLILCSSPASALAQDNPLGKSDIRITPSVLFRGDLARIAPHLDLAASGCVKVDHVGKKRLFIHLEMWRDGKPSRRDIGMVGEREAGELSFSLRDVKDEHGKSRYRLILAMGGVTIARHIVEAIIPAALGGSAGPATKLLRSAWPKRSTRARRVAGRVTRRPQSVCAPGGGNSSRRTRCARGGRTWRRDMLPSRPSSRARTEPFRLV